MNKNEVAKMEKNALANQSVLSDYMDTLGYESAKLDRNENGKIAFTHTYEKEGVEVTDSLELKEETAKKVDALAILADLDQTKLPLTCVTLRDIEKTEIHKDLGYKSFGQFAVDNLKQFKRISDNQIRQYVNVGKTFFTDDEKPTFRKDWLKGTSVTVLCKLIAFYNAYCKQKFVDSEIDHDSALDAFYADFIETEKLKLKNRTVPEVVEQLKKLSGKPEKKDGKKDGKKGIDNSNNDNATPLDTLQSALVAYTTAPDSVAELIAKCNELLTAIENLSK